MGNSLAISFSAGQLAVIVLVLGALVWWGFTRLVGGMDQRFDKLSSQLGEIPKNHPTRHELNLAIDGVHRRVSDLRADMRREAQAEEL